MSQGARARIDTGALVHNLRRIREAAPDSAVMAVIKADAYGHGILDVARALADADALAVAHVDEALTLREGSSRAAIVVLEGAGDTEELAAADAADLDLVVHSPEQLQMLAGWPGSARFTVWLKVDTGMNRLGFRVEDAPAAVARLRDCRAVAGPVRLMTHLACADQIDSPANDAQLAAFTRLLAGEGGVVRSIANSAALLSRPDTRVEWVRPGLALYGASPFAPFDGGSGGQLGLRPVMTLETQLIATKRVVRGETVGYGGCWRAPADTRIGVAAIGYGDGYPRQAPDGTPVLVGGRRVGLVGRVSMDMITVDLGSLPQAQVGDPVVLWGSELPVEEIARHAGTIAYTLLTGVTRRVRRYPG